MPPADPVQSEEVSDGTARHGSFCFTCGRAVRAEILGLKMKGSNFGTGMDVRSGTEFSLCSRFKFVSRSSE